MDAKNNGLPVKQGGTWIFPPVSAVRFATSPSIRRELPGYVSYSEFQMAMHRDAIETDLPTKDEVLSATRQIKTANDFLCRTWMRKVRSVWEASSEPKFSYLSKSGSERYWWCEVPSAKGWGTHNFLLLAVGIRGRLLRYAFYSAGDCGDRYFCLRIHDECGCETEVELKTVRSVMSSLCRMSRYGDNLICCEKKRDEYIQASRNRDGTFYVEYQLYHMPWQMCCKKVTADSLACLIKTYCAGGASAIANEFDWRCCDRPIRVTYDLGKLLCDCRQAALKHKRTEIVETIRAVGVGGTDPRRIEVPLFVRHGRPVEWVTSLYYMPKNSSKTDISAVKVGAALMEKSFANYAHEVGEIFFDGEGVARDYRLSLYWELKAKRRGSTKAVPAIERLKSYMDPRRLEKSAEQRNLFERKIDEISIAVNSHRLVPDDAWDQLYDIQALLESRLYDGKLVKRDFSAVEKNLSRVLLRLEKLCNREAEE